MPKFVFKLGTPVEAIVSGFRGFVVARTQHISRCNTYLVEPTIDKDGKLGEIVVIDENMLKVDTTRSSIDIDAVKAGEPPG